MTRPLYGSNIAPARDTCGDDYSVVHLCDGRTWTSQWSLATAIKMASEENARQGDPEVSHLCSRGDSCLGYGVWLEAA